MSTTNSGPKLPTGAELMRRMRLEPDPWQIDVLESGHPRVLLNCCRQAGKSTAVAYLALAEARMALPQSLKLWAQLLCGEPSEPTRLRQPRILLRSAFAGAGFNAVGSIVDLVGRHG